MEKVMVITPAMVDATKALLEVMLEDAGSLEKFVCLPPMEQAHIMGSPIVRNRLLNIVGEVLQSEAERLTGE
jgi:hypothetical protein